MPAVRVRPEQVVIQAGKSFNATCEVDGQPHPALRWDVSSLKSSYQVHNVSRDVQLLTIQSASYNDTGSLECIVSSVAGWRAAAVNLTVKGRFLQIQENVIVS